MIENAISSQPDPDMQTKVKGGLDAISCCDLASGESRRRRRPSPDRGGMNGTLYVLRHTPPP